MDDGARAIYVGIGEMRVGAHPVILSAVGIGSCVAVVLVDTQRHVGGMAHVMLPCAPRAPREGANLFKYADWAIGRMIEELEALGGLRSRLRAKIVGGAHMFQSARDDYPEKVGTRNVAAVRQTLGELGIPVVSEDTGGALGRSLEIDLEDGTVRVRSLRRDPLVL